MCPAFGCCCNVTILHLQVLLSGESSGGMLVHVLLCQVRLYVQGLCQYARQTKQGLGPQKLTSSAQGLSVAPTDSSTHCFFLFSICHLTLSVCLCVCAPVLCARVCPKQSSIIPNMITAAVDILGGVGADYIKSGKCSNGAPAAFLKLHGVKDPFITYDKQVWVEFVLVGLNSGHSDDYSNPTTCVQA